MKCRSLIFVLIPALIVCSAKAFDIGLCCSTDWLYQSTCYLNMPTWSSHGINKLYVLKMISPVLDGYLTKYDYVFSVGNTYGIETYAGMTAEMTGISWRQILIDYANAHKNMAGVAGYCQPDEPVDNIAFEDMQAVYQLFKTYDPGHPVWAVFTSSIRFHGEWIPYVDVPAGDTYAVGYGIPLWQSTLNAKRIADLAATHGKNTKRDFLIQCSDHDGGSSIPYPTLYQNRYLSYGPLTVGITGIFYYSVEYLTDTSKLNNIIYPVCDEMRALEDVFDSTEPAPVITTNRDSDTTGHRLNDVTYLVKACNNKVYIIAVNNTDSTISVTFDIDGLDDGSASTVDVLYESRTVPYTDNGSTGQFTDSFNGYDAHVYSLDIPAEPEYILSILSRGGNGSYDIDPNYAAYSPGTSITLSAEPDLHYEFRGWATDLTMDADNPVVMTMNGNKEIKTVFAPDSGSNSFVFGFEGQFGWWMDNNYEEPVYFVAGGNPDGHFEIESAGNPYLYPRCSIQGIGPFSGNLGAKYGDEFKFSIDLKVKSPGKTITSVRYIHIGESDGDWRYDKSVSINEADGWTTIRIPFNANWSDSEATGNGWSHSSGAGWQETTSDTDGKFSYFQIRGYSPISGGIIAGIDNWGFVAPHCGDADYPYPPGDFSEDCKIDNADLAILVNEWLSEYDFYDFADMADNWMEQTFP
ncbi:MAG: hypothetical protein ABIG61_04115 [Planctomycetota bacterium]